MNSILKSQINNRLLYFFGIAGLLILSYRSVAQEGRPFIRHYSNEEIGATTIYWSMEQDSTGWMYFGSSVGLVIFDGINWSLVPVENSSTIRSLAYDEENNRIYAGAQGELGFFDLDSMGNRIYHSLMLHIPEEDRGFKDIWKTYVRPDGVYFQTWSQVFRWNGKEMDIWKAEARFHQSFFVNNTYWIKENGVGLLLMDHDTLHLPKGSDILANLRIYSLLPWKDGKMIAGTREEGFKILHYRPFQDSLVVHDLPTNDQEFLLSSNFYGGLRLKSGGYLFNTTIHGIFFLDEEGRIHRKLNKQTGLPIDNVKSMFEDREGSVWLATNNGIIRVDFTDPISFFGETEELFGRVYAVNIFKDKLIAGNGQGIFEYDGQNFKNLEGLEGLCWDIEKVEFKGQESLLVSNDKGIFYWDQNRAVQISDQNAYDLESSKAHPGHVLAGGLILKNKNGKWEAAYKFEDMVGDILVNTEDCHANLWYSTRRHGVYQVGAHDFNTAAYRIHHYDTNMGLPNLIFPRVIIWACDVLLWTTEGIYKFDVESHHFFYDSLLNKELTIEGGTLSNLTVDKDGGLWAYSLLDRIEEFQMIRATMDQDGNLITQNLSSLKKSSSLSLNNLHQEENVYWFSSPNGVVRYDYDLEDKFSKGPGFVTQIDWLPLDVENESQVIGDFSSGMKLKILKNQLEIDQEYLKPPTERQVLPFKHNSQIFDVTSIYFKSPEKLSYRYRLEGKEMEWSDWVSDNSQIYFNLREGDYELMVETRNVYGERGRSISLAFEVLPPWYRTIPAFISYLFLFGLSLFAAARISAIRLRRQKKMLEKVVNERTSEIRHQKEEIEKKNTELEQQKEEIQATAENLKMANESIADQKSIIEKKNLDITDSIQYAKYIQEAMLPQLGEIKRSLKDSFILFKPKDIVSGDFFWYAEARGLKIVAAVDCTGHGVPGAFMSMLGSTLLQQVIFEKHATDAGEILTLLNEGVRESLSQQDSHNRDGMDLALCVIDEKKKTVNYAGAKNPLVFIDKSNGIQTIRGDKFPIGGFQVEGEVRFNSHKLEIKEPTTIYMFSDGFQDQFGGPKGKKYMIKQLKGDFERIWNKEGFDQLAYLEKKFNDWRGRHEQLDDILVMGFKLE